MSPYHAVYALHMYDPCLSGDYTFSRQKGQGGTCAGIVSMSQLQVQLIQRR